MNGGDVSGSLVVRDEDGFYEKLHKLNESSGLSPIFNFRQTSLDLYKLYEQVTIRGGYHQVSKDKSWDAVASSLIPEGSSLLRDQLQKIYRTLLYPFELIHYYRTSAKVPTKLGPTSDNTSSKGNCLSCLTKKRKMPPVSIICYDAKQLENAKKKSNITESTKSPTVKRSPIEKSAKETSVENEDRQSYLEAPVRPRDAYQLFIKKECKRLRETHGESTECSTTLGMAIKAWLELPAEKRELYIEESKKEEKRFDREMKTYKGKNPEILKPRKRPSYVEYFQIKTCNEEENSRNPKPRFRPKKVLDRPEISCREMGWPIAEGDYHVTVQPLPKNIRVPMESDIKLAIQSKKNESANITLFQMNLEEYVD